MNKGKRAAFVKVKLDGRTVEVHRSVYIRAKTRDLKEFGYTTLTEEHVGKQLDLIVSGVTTIAGGLDVIGGFMVDDIELGAKGGDQ